MFTEQDLNSWHEQQTAKLPTERHTIVPRFECADGFVVSIQASAGHYCIPRQNRFWPYHCFELGYPTAKDDALWTYIDGNAEDDQTQSVFGYVPANVVVELINRHGGPKKP